MIPEGNYKTIPNFPNYLIFDDGRVWSLAKHVFLKQRITWGGYYTVGLKNKEQSASRFVHRLLAEAFIPNPNNYKVVNHKNENKLNNSLDNLEWCNAKYNTNYGTGIERRSISQGKKVRCIETGIIYNTLAEAERATGIPHSSIGLVCRGKFSQTHNTHWEYVDRPEN